MELLRIISDHLSMRDWVRAKSTCKAWLALPITKLDLRKSANNDRPFGPTGVLWASRHYHTAHLVYLDTTNLPGWVSHPWSSLCPLSRLSPQTMIPAA
ncbi:hypothetical protein COCOBI_04-0320 [Coccomyxa sp. Obi]|nr:hypothetical protein COCOBI_04-0320 [Coccomyxa sp. Obi]